MAKLIVIAAVFASALLAVQPAATAPPDTITVSGSTFTIDPGTATCVLVDHALVRCDSIDFVTGFSGSLSGTSSTDAVVLINCITGRYHGVGVETFNGSVDTVGSGTLTLQLQESGTVTPDCSDIATFEATGVVIGGTGDLAGLNGTLSFEGSSYSGSLH